MKLANFELDYQKAFVIEQLKNLADYQKKRLIEKGKYVDELKAIWRKKWGLEYPYWSDCTGKIKEE